MPRYTEVNYTIDMEADWRITHCPKGYAFVIKRPDSSVVCQLHNGLTPHDKALAQLISAAPDMLAALETLAHECSSMQLDHFMLVLSAIAKATGESDE